LVCGDWGGLLVYVLGFRECWYEFWDYVGYGFVVVVRVVWWFVDVRVVVGDWVVVERAFWDVCLYCLIWFFFVIFL